MIINDMAKLESPFVRKEIDGVYVVTPEIAEGYEWVFNDPQVQAIEKLDGTNVSIIVEHGKITRIFNRTTEIDFWSGSPIIQCLLNSSERKWLHFTDGQYFGEAIGEKIQGNPLKVPRIWMPFSLAYTKLAYHSWHKYPKTFEGISFWFKEYLFSLMAQKYGVSELKVGRDKNDMIPIEFKPFAEGVVFTHPDGRMAKLRRDMFSWYYELYPNAKQHQNRKKNEQEN